MHGSTRLRSGFTLVELLVSASVIAVLTGLLLPATHQVREAARRTTCKNHLRQVGLALHGYHDVNGSLPLAHASARNSDGEYLQQSWTKQILPLLERRDLFDGWDRGLGFSQGSNRDLVATPIEVYRCPSSSAEDVEPFRLGAWPAADVKTSPAPEFDAGVAEYFAVSQFVGRPGAKFGSGLGMLPFQTLRTQPFGLDVPDGSSNTIAAGECAGGSKRFLAGGRAMGPQDPALGQWAGRNRLVLKGYDPVSGSVFRGDRLINVTNRGGENFFGFHLGGVQVLFGDGSCRFLSESTDFDVVAKLCVVDDGSPVHGY